MKYTTITNISLSDKDLDALQRAYKILGVIDTQLLGIPDANHGTYWTVKDLEALHHLVSGVNVDEGCFLIQRGNIDMFKQFIHYDKEA